eukprot:CAMPEP_0168442048 /NCGR_PEP_ID=MMETSP0228-20121227/43806_1 /TAXON_ID=133427 /ORGANISM="Protoceratium reticulatum, Strain CCCM 535 (=CCMP 1889)" /LENGTH=114 /DNA_ID=CAMNT_0008456395 /DNA_START=8 /DNA_END=348 /DNA_ORIENTATION=-
MSGRRVSKPGSEALDRLAPVSARVVMRPGDQDLGTRARALPPGDVKHAVYVPAQLRPHAGLACGEVVDQHLPGRAASGQQATAAPAERHALHLVVPVVGVHLGVDLLLQPPCAR